MPEAFPAIALTTQRSLEWVPALASLGRDDDFYERRVVFLRRRSVPSEQPLPAFAPPLRPATLFLSLIPASDVFQC